MLYHKFLLLSLLLTGCTFISAADTTVIKLEDAQAAGVASDPIVLPVAVPVNDNIEKKTTSSSTTTTTTTTPQPHTTTSTTPAPTTSTTSSTTTSAPVTTTLAPITTTPKPGPYPAPKIGVWNSTCIKVQLAAQLNFTYVNKDNKTSTALYNIPETAVVDHATCNLNGTQAIQINWGPAAYQHSMSLQFSRDNTIVNMTMLLFNLALTKEDFPDAKENQTIQLLHVNPEFKTPIKMSYHCTRKQVLQLNETVGTPVNGYVTVEDLQLEAYRNANGTSAFSVAHDCDSSGTSDIVPIAVGIALAALIIIVLVAYLCARRRSILRGYMSF